MTPCPDRPLAEGEQGKVRDLRSYGRRRGRKQSSRQTGLLTNELPQYALKITDAPPSPLGALFAAPVDDVWLEIGFGGAEHLLWQARANPKVGLIGCEPFQDGVVKALSAIEREHLTNVRLHADDARPLLRWLPRAEIGRAFILFPDPWPKKRHHKRRLISTATLAELARVMRRGSKLRIATDIGEYARSILLAAGQQAGFTWTAQTPGDWRARPADWPPTRYEQKAITDGRKCVYFSFLRV